MVSSQRLRHLLLTMDYGLRTTDYGQWFIKLPQVGGQAVLFPFEGELLVVVVVVPVVGGVARGVFGEAPVEEVLVLALALLGDDLELGPGAFEGAVGDARGAGPAINFLAAGGPQAQQIVKKGRCLGHGLAVLAGARQ